MPRRFLVIIVFLWLSILQTSGQQLMPRGEFLEDSIRIGEPVHYSLSFKYPKKFQVIFPDSMFDFSPFEMYSREYFPTISDTLNSRDSAVFSLLSFEIDSIQTLSLPVYLINEGDSNVLYPDIDTIYFSEVIPVLPDSVALKEGTAHNPIPLQVNYPLIIGIAIALLIILIILGLIFGKPIKKWLHLSRTRNNHKRFLKDFDKSIAEFEKQPATQSLLNSVVIWKKYMEGISSLSYTKLTTKELEKIFPESEHIGSLRSLDRGIYGGMFENKFDQELGDLKQHAEQTFSDRITQIKNG